MEDVTALSLGVRGEARSWLDILGEALYFTQALSIPRFCFLLFSHLHAYFAWLRVAPFVRRGEQLYPRELAIHRCFCGAKSRVYLAICMYLQTC